VAVEKFQDFFSKHNFFQIFSFLLNPRILIT
jgi:hypothetical protein